MRIRSIRIERYRGIDQLEFQPGACTVIIGPNNAGKSAVLEGLDLLLNPRYGRYRMPPDELDYFGREPGNGFEIEAVLGDLTGSFLAEAHQHLEGWRRATAEVVAEPEGDGVEPVVRVRARGTADLDLVHEFAKPESEGTRFSPGLRERVGWVFDGRVRDPARQLFFYQGGLLDRLFGDVDLGEAIQTLRVHLAEGATAVNTNDSVVPVLQELSDDLIALGLLDQAESAAFEAGDVSQRALLQTLRLTLPGATEGSTIPLSRQGRGAQRLVLVSVLLRLAAKTGHATIAGFEEPEEALEPLRQAHLARMLAAIAQQGGQVFLVTHSPEIARCFDIEDFLVLPERTTGAQPRHLYQSLTPPVRQTYERRLDGALVRGLFCRVPLLVEGPSDQGVFLAFWNALVEAGQVLPLFRLGLDVLNAESVSNMPMIAAVLRQAGKSVVAWVDTDSEDAVREVERLRREQHCAAIMLYDGGPDRQNLEQALAWSCSLTTLAAALTALADDREYSWDDQKKDLLSRCSRVDSKARETAKGTTSVNEFLNCLAEEDARRLIGAALGAKKVSPFEMKGTRQGRIVAETIIREEGVPSSFAAAFRQLDQWVRSGSTAGVEIKLVLGG